MPVTDPIADMLAILKNGFTAKKEAVFVKRSKITENILDILKKEGFISNFKAIEDSGQGAVKVYLKYDKNNGPALRGLKRVSKPGRRIYKKTEEIRPVYGGIGVAIISTSKGLMTDAKAKESKIGGELICEIW